MPALHLLSLLTLAAAPPLTSEERVAVLLGLPGCVALWDFVAREPGATGRFIAHTPPGREADYALDPHNYIRSHWGAGREATQADFPLLGRGPFGQAIELRNETDADFRPLLAVPRSRLHNTPLDIKGPRRSVTVVVWTIRESGNHALAGIWHEGTDLSYAGAVQRKERGQRQYALFAGLQFEGSACGHVSDNGAGSFAFRYALHKSHSRDLTPRVPAEAAPEVLDASWHTVAMTLDAERQELTGWIDGVASERWFENPRADSMWSNVVRAWEEGHRAGTPAADSTFPADQHYLPPETAPSRVSVLEATVHRRVEEREYPYTRVRVELRWDGAQWKEESRELVAVKVNPWWYPHGIYVPADDGTGGPFTIGRVIHSGRSVGFTGWIGGVAVFDRALTAVELARLSQFNAPLAVPAR
ncbi:MAG TPA: hypothetical protein DCZ72_11535 [Armatimonadetes bacterium]|nr:hypothetical protein [Armatimonadota bacterium]